MQGDSMGKWVIAVALAVIVGAGLLLVVTMNSRKVMLSVGGQVVYARVADTYEKRQKGLSGTAKLGPNEAMLFIFETSGQWGIWMKDMRYSIDILWLDDNKRIVHTEENIAPGTYPTTFSSDKDARYVIELPAGFVRQHHVGLGQVVGFSTQ